MASFRHPRPRVKRPTLRYTMRDGNKVIKYGITDRPAEVRQRENKAKGVKGTLRPEGPRVSRQTAIEWERQRIKQYRQRFGRNPPRNKV